MEEFKLYKTYKSIGGLREILSFVVTPKHSPIGSKKGSKSGKIKNEKIGLYFQIHRLIVYSTLDPILVELCPTQFKFVFYSYKLF